MANPIEDDPKLAQAVGILAGRWGLVEAAVELLFTTISGTPHRKATIIFSFFRNVNTQRDVIRFMVRESPTLSEALATEINGCLNTYAEMAAERNAVIHFPFGWDTDADTPTIYKMVRQRTGDELYIKSAMNADTVRALAERVTVLHDRLLVCLTDILGDVAASFQKSLPKSANQTPAMTPAPPPSQKRGGE